MKLLEMIKKFLLNTPILHKVELFLCINIGMILMTPLLSQEYGELMYVAAKNGLIIRSSPNTDSQIIGSLNFQDSILYKPIDVIDTLDLRIAYWVELDLDTIKGYIFSGYLNNRVPPSEKYVSLRDMWKYFKVNYPSLIDTTIFIDNPGDKSDKTIYLSMGLNHSSRGWHIWEYSYSETIYEDITINDIINLIELTDFNGENIEYQILVESNKMNFDNLKYTHAINDPPQIEVTISKVYPKGVKLIVHGGL
ncbi:hypothetical protein CEQ90_20135 [Lewinellaceae bacterium SD302]|nr:hypothetical protein CEQ90_20135 [Lewinellaceae bacterium SD302]